LAVLVWAADGRILSCNLAARALLGAPPRAVVVGELLDQVLGNEGEARRLEQACPAGGEPSAVEAWQVPGQPPHVALARQVMALQGVAGEPVYLCLFGASTGSFALAGDARSHYACAVSARIAHDLGNLLAPILGNVALLEDELPGGHALRHRLEAIRESMDSARTFVQRLAALDPGRRAPLHPADLVAVVNRTVPALQSGLRPGVTLQVIDQGPIDGVRLDRRQIERVLAELVSNAQDAMPSGGRVTIELDMHDPTESGAMAAGGDRWVRLRVRDTGRGMDPSMLRHAFEPFATTKVPGGAAGLGLAGVATVARQHDGVARVESQVGLGTTITLLLPGLGYPAPVDALLTPSPETTRAPARTPEASATVLLVEDNAMVRRSIEATLRGMGYQVLAVDSGARCLETVEKTRGPIDLLMTDVVMPEMGGKELIERVRAIRPGIPVLFMSGYDRATLASRKEPIAFEHFLQKPFDSDDLASAVRAAIAAGSLGQAAKSTLG
jgi:two-component system cell cycle sensor histidine kinase/response regulator CckA